MTLMQSVCQHRPPTRPQIVIKKAPLDDSIITAELVEPLSLTIRAPVVEVGVFILMLLFVKTPDIFISLKKIAEPAQVN